MTDNEIKENVERFIKERLYNYALMINGSWGCGKTFFVCKNLIPHLKELKYDVNYISLYGVSDPNEISDRLCEQAIRDKISRATGKNMEGKGAQIASLVIGRLMKYGLRKIDADGLGEGDIFSLIPNYDNNIIIFDDLERCNCNICSILGYINNFIEHSNASVIIIANEEEIGKWDHDNNQEMQMLVALNPRLSYELPAMTFEEAFNKKGNIVHDTLTPEQVHRARRIIFEDGEKYRKTKEKTIGITIDYKPDLHRVFQMLIIDSIKNEVLRDKLLQSTEVFVQMANLQKHGNLRTFQFFLEKMNCIMECICEETYPVVKIVAEYCFRSTISRMKGEKPPEWDINEYGVQSFGNSFSPIDNPYGFKFIDELITSNSIDKEYVREMLKGYCHIEEARGSLEGDPCRKLQDWYKSDDTQLHEWLEQIDNNIRNGKYSTCIFPDIIKNLSIFIAENVYVELCEKIFESMKAFIPQAPKDKLEKFAPERFMLEEPSYKIYKEKIQTLSEMFGEIKVQSAEELWKSVFETKNWATEIFKYVGNSEAGDRTFIHWIDSRKICNLLHNASNENIFLFRKALFNSYKDDLYSEHWRDDLDKLKTLKCKLENDQWEGIIQTKNINWIIQDIQGLINKFSEDNIGNNGNQN